MGSRRIERMSKLIMRSVSDVIMNQLNDPRIEGVISVTRVDLAPDMKKADVYLSIMTGSAKKDMNVLHAINHASSHISALVAKDVTARVSPKLSFQVDKVYKKTLETLKLIEQVSDEIKESDQTNLEDEDERQ